MRVGFTGHQDLPSGGVAEIGRRIRAELAKLDDTKQLIGVSSLAEGADQLFALSILSVKGRLEVVIPSANYESTFSGDALEQYHHLLASASNVRRLPFPEPSEDAFFAAGRTIVDGCERLLAVWDGKPAKGLGGTADVVHYARKQDVPVTIIWPKGLVRG